MMHSSMPREGSAPPGSAPPAGAPSVEPGTSEARAGDVLRAARRAGRQLYLAGPEGHFLGFGRSLEGLGLSAQAIKHAQGSSVHQRARSQAHPLAQGCWPVDLRP